MRGEQSGLRKHLATCMVALLFATPAAAQELQLGPITAQLYYKSTGELSDDLLARDPAFVGWNTVIGEGDAGGPAEDLLVAVTLSQVNGEDAAFLEDTLELWVTDEGGGEIARRDFEGLLVPYQGGVANPLWLSNVGCAGLLEFHARFRGQEKSAFLRLDCGE